MPWKTLFRWHDAQVCWACWPASGNTEWLNVVDPPCHDGAPGRWQSSQVVGKPAAAWLGFCARAKSAWWQLEHSVDVPRKTLFRWQLAQAVVWCGPVSGNEALWSKRAWLNATSEGRWHASQAVGKPAAA
ncbi:MAG: hypothetical protein R2708_26570 [Vicinamibacterales bacterium]